MRLHASAPVTVTACCSSSVASTRALWPVRTEDPGCGTSGRADRVAGTDITVVTRSTVLPAHLGRAWQRLDALLLRGLLPAGDEGGEQTIVATLPWQWPAVRGCRGARRVLDVADDWAALIPRHARRIRELYARAAHEADEIIAVSEHLREQFEGRRVTVIRNGVDERMLRDPLTPPPEAQRMAYVGTLSERFDAPLVGRLLDRLPGWTVELVGPCAYARGGSEPGPELRALLARPDGRVRLHAAVGRERLSSVLDEADVLLLPNRAGHSRGQDSMKIYDYAARGRPIVSTAAARDGVSDEPPGLYVGADADQLAVLVRNATIEPGALARQRSRWAAAQAWDCRWPEWSQALFGATVEHNRASSALDALLRSSLPESRQPHHSRLASLQEPST